MAAISSDGRFVAYQSKASNLVGNDTNVSVDVFVHDRQEGTTERVSLASDGAQSNGDSFTGALSADGRFVVFSSDASNLVERRHQRLPRRVRSRSPGRHHRAGQRRDRRHPDRRPQLRLLQPRDQRGRPVGSVQLRGDQPGGRRHQRFRGRVPPRSSHRRDDASERRLRGQSGGPRERERHDQRGRPLRRV